MKNEPSLRKRVIVACVLLAAVVGAAFSAATYVLNESMEHELIDRRLHRAADTLIAGHRDGTAVVLPNDLRFVRGEDLPRPLRSLPPGLHELELDGHGLHVLILDEDGKRYALIDDLTDFERLEAIAFVVLVVTLGAGLLLGAGVGTAIAGSVIAPVTALAQAVDRDTLHERPELLRAGEEIGQLARAFEGRSRTLRQALARERLFTADVSHELRTPLAAMLGAAEMLEAQLADQPALRAAAERLRRNAGDAAQRVAALLQLARTPEQAAREWLDLRTLVEREFERNRPLVADKPVRYSLQVQQPVWVEATPELAAVAIDNLLRNACQYTQEGAIDVRLDAAALVVEDTGPGVPEPRRGRLFEPGPNPPGDAAASGTGLGLSIVRRMAEHLGWQIAYEARRGGGSRFLLQFRTIGDRT